MYYKVFRIDENGDLRSIYSDSIDYRKNQWNYPKFGMIFLFDTLKNAFSFYKKIPCVCEIWQVDALNAGECIEPIARRIRDFVTFWDTQNETIIVPRIFPPVGTYWADAVFPVKKANYSRLSNRKLKGK